MRPREPREHDGLRLSAAPPKLHAMMPATCVARRSAYSRLRAWMILAALAALAVLSVGARQGAAQVGSGVAGAAGGLVAGGYTMAAIYVAEARFGRFLHSYDEMLALRPEILPVVAGAFAGGWLGAESSTALGRAAGWGGIGLVGGAALGAGVGHLVWRSSEGRWAGGIIGSAVGLVTGAILGAADGLDERAEGRPVALFSFSLPLGGGG